MWRYEDAVDAGSSGIFRHISHAATSIRVEYAWVVKQVNTIPHHDLKEALTVLLLRCLIDFASDARSKSTKDVV